MPGNLDEADKLRKQVSTLAAFGKRVLRVKDMGGLLQEATGLVSEAIEVDLVKVLELLPDRATMLVRAGVNWKPGVVGHATIPAGEGSGRNQPESRTKRSGPGTVRRTAPRPLAADRRIIQP